MISAGLVLVLGLMDQDVAERPPRPSDDAMLAQLLERRPGTRVISVSFHETPRGGGRFACGLIDIDGAIEPFAVLAAWHDIRPPVIRREGVPLPPPEPAGWGLFDIAPEHSDRNSDGVIDRGERNGDTLARKMALASCKISSPITPPPGVHWTLELERGPEQPRITFERLGPLADGPSG
ncbi:hypothetical protein [Brevundimonas sp.]|uniref:hypothetical protein n=1 Tax=Brevundimonas sp. TaxID=1871086 RepID=UPI002FC84F81